MLYFSRHSSYYNNNHVLTAQLHSMLAMPMEKEKGEGGASSLERRLANQFYNKYIRLALVNFLF